MYLYQDTRDLIKSRDLIKKVDLHEMISLKMKISLLEFAIIDIHGFKGNQRIYGKNIRMIKEILESTDKVISVGRVALTENEGPSLSDYLQSKEYQDGQEKWERRARKRIWEIKRNRYKTLFEAKKRLKKRRF